MEGPTIHKYINVWKQVLGYTIRTRFFDTAYSPLPPFKLTDLQTRLLDSFLQLIQQLEPGSSEPTGGYPSPLKRVCLDFLVSLLDHPIPDSEYDSILLSALAAMGIREDGGWLQPSQYTTTYSAIIKIARIVVIQQSFLEVQEQQEGLRKSLFVTVREKVSRFMVLNHNGNLPTPLDWIFEARSYGMKIAFTTPMAGLIYWSGNSFSYRDIHLSMELLTEFTHTLVGQLASTIDELVFTSYGISQPEVDWLGLADNRGEEAVGYSFLTDPRNAEALAGLDSWLLQQACSHQRLQKRWIKVLLTRSDFEPTQVRSYLEKVDRSRQLLLIGIHVLAGQPARATELLGLRFLNTSYGNIRNIFIEDRMVCLAFAYHKGYQLSGRAKVIYRFLPYELGVLLVRYLAVVLPFAQQLELQGKEGAEITPFLWETSFLRPQGAGSDDDSRVRVWSSDKMRRILSDFSLQQPGSRLTISNWRHIAVAIGRRFIKQLQGTGPVEPIPSSDDEGIDEEQDIPDSVFDLQAGHSSYVGDLVYGRGAAFGRSGLATIWDRFRDISCSWHALWSFDSYDQNEATGSNAQLHHLGRHLTHHNPIHNPIHNPGHHYHSVRQDRLARLQQVDLKGMLRQLLQNDTAEFRGNQNAVLLAVVRGLTPILQVAGTAGGKSLTFLLPAFATGAQGVTIVIVPFISLKNNILERCSTMGIHCEIWSEKITQFAPLILVTPETFQTAGFAAFIQRLTIQHLLNRIVFDEAHTVLDASYDFRPKLLSIGQAIAKIGVQLIFLTATLPPRDEPRFWNLLGLQPRQPRIYRIHTSIRNISYLVRSVASEEEERDLAIQLAEEAVANPSPTKVVIYCQGKGLARLISQKLACYLYFSDVAEEEEKETVIREWVKRSGAIVATSALGVGMDIPDIR